MLPCLREEVQRAVFVGELASLQLSLTLEAFQASNKEALAGSLLRSRSNSPKVSAGSCSIAWQISHSVCVCRP